MREINYLKPIDKGSYRDLASYQVVISVNSEVASKVIALEVELLAVERKQHGITK